MGLKPVILTSGLNKSERDHTYEEINHGSYNVIIGTQSLIREKLSFSKLGLVIIDEQHRFGVRERALMCRKGQNPHLLVMTATPIPRTLAIAAYGDMDISVIEDYPPGHRPATTCLVRGPEKRKLLEILKERMSTRQQAFVICPVIQGAEDTAMKNAVDMAEKLKKILTPPFRIGLIHGRLPPHEREGVMEDFRKGRINLLVGTTVLEVGVHVPGATVMIIEHPERFGLAQIHQLRGRVGRGSDRGLCFLVLDDDLPDHAVSRLRVVADHHNGFEIARKDLELRGHGEFVGTRQSGLGELDYTEIVRESEILFKAQEEARRLIDQDPDLSRAENARLKAMVESLLCTPLDL
jgi:ATP-dependent DNA helicase RecG